MPNVKTREEYAAIVQKIVNLLANENCTVSESKNLLGWARTEVEKSPTAQCEVK